jgi:hypothetical protein
MAEGAGLVLRRVPSLELDMDGADVLDADVGVSDACAGESSVVISIKPLVVVVYSRFTAGDAFDASRRLPNRAPRDAINERVVGSSSL